MISILSLQSLSTLLIKYFMDFIQKYIPLPQDQIRLLGGILLSFPLSLVLKQLTNKYINIIYSSSLAFYMQYFVLRQEAYFLWIQQLLVYLICLIAPRRRLGIIVLIQSFTYLTLIHLRRYFMDSGVEVDVTAIMMMSTCKFIGLAFSYQDGEKNESELAYPDQAERAVIQFPSFLVYVGYVQFLPGALIGPVFEFSDYVNYIERKKNYQKIPSTLKPAVIQMIRSLIYCGIYTVLSLNYSINDFVTPVYKQAHVLKQMYLVIIVLLIIRFKYYGCWIMSNIGMIASGICYEKVKNEQGLEVDSHKRIEVVRVDVVELDASIKRKVDGWNMSVQVFLKRYVYQRIYREKEVDPKHKKAYQASAQSFTISLSAFWHGIYPCYIVSFIHWMLVLQIAQQIFRLSRMYPKLQKIYDESKIVQIFALIFANYYFSYYGIFFNLYRLERIWIFAQTNFGIQTILLYLGYVLIVLMRVGEKKEKREPKKLN